MNQPAGKGKSAVFWLVLAAVGTCGGCSLLTLAVLLLGLFTPESSPGPAAPTSAAMAALPTGETPDRYPGSPGWLPSGRGVNIPAAELVDGQPEGLWWRYTVLSDGKTFGAGVTLFLSDGTCATNPRPGGGALFDLDGQRRQAGHTGVGTCVFSDGKLTRTADGFTSTDTFESGSDDDGAFFMIGPGKYSPLTPPTADLLVGNWKSPSGKFVFSGDGTFEMGNVLFNEGYVIAAGGRGTWQLDGYLLAVRPPDAPSWITTVGMTGESFLVIGQTVYKRQ